MLFSLAAALHAQGAATVYVQEGTPTTPAAGAIWIQPSTGTVKFVATTSPLTWATAAGGGGESVPAGANILIDSGTCPTGYTENTALNGKTLIGTIAANGNVGTTGGSDTITPQGSNAAVSAGTPAGTNSAPTFSGTAWSAPAISWPAGVPTHAGTTASFTGNSSTTVVNHVHTLATGTGSTGNFAQVIGTVDTSSGGTGGTPTQTALGTLSGNPTAGGAASYTPTGSVTITSQGTISWPAGVPSIGSYTPGGSVTAPTFTGSALGTHTHTFTGTQFDNRSSFAYVIVCTKS